MDPVPLFQDIEEASDALMVLQRNFLCSGRQWTRRIEFPEKAKRFVGLNSGQLHDYLAPVVKMIYQLPLTMLAVSCRIHLRESTFTAAMLPRIYGTGTIMFVIA